MLFSLATHRTRDRRQSTSMITKQRQGRRNISVLCSCMTLAASVPLFSLSLLQFRSPSSASPRLISIACYVTFPIKELSVEMHRLEHFRCFIINERVVPKMVITSSTAKQTYHCQLVKDAWVWVFSISRFFLCFSQRHLVDECALWIIKMQIAKLR